MTILAIDTCIRSNQTGLGTASDGINTWGSITNSATANIVSNEASISNCVSGFPVVLLGSLTTTDINFLVRVNQVNNIYDGIGPCFRVIDANNLYFIALYAGSGGLVFAKLVNGGFSALGSGTFSLNTNTYSWVRVVMAGNHLQARIWADGSSEPSTWTIDTTDSTYASAGQFGMSFNAFGSSSDVAKFDHITVTDNQSGGGSTTTHRSYVSRFSQYASSKRKFTTRFFQLGRGIKTWESRFSQYAISEKLFATRFHQVPYITGIKPFRTRFRHYAITIPTTTVTATGRDGKVTATGL